MTLEESIAEFVDALEVEREGLWQASWAVARAVHEQGPAAPRHALFGAFAEAGACSRQRVGQLYSVAVAFPEPGLVRLEKTWTWHRACARAAIRAQRPALEVASEAIEKGWGQRELDTLGRAGNGGHVSYAGECGECGAKIRVRMLAGMRGHPVCCPVCSAEPERTNGEIGILG